MNGLGMIASRMQALQERAEKAEGALDRLLDTLTWVASDGKRYVALREDVPVDDHIAFALAGEGPLAPPPDLDRITIHFAQHRSGPIEGCRLCDDAMGRLLRAVLAVGEQP